MQTLLKMLRPFAVDLCFKTDNPITRQRSEAYNASYFIYDLKIVKVYFENGYQLTTWHLKIVTVYFENGYKTHKRRFSYISKVRTSFLKFKIVTPNSNINEWEIRSHEYNWFNLISIVSRNLIRTVRKNLLQIRLFIHLNVWL